MNERLKEKNLINYYIMQLDRSGRLLLAGSFDFCYYHEVEILFHGVSFICCPTTNFTINCIRNAKEEEILNLNKNYDIDKSGYTIALDDELQNTTYYVVAEKFEYNFEIVKYYNEEKIMRNSVLSDWARKQFSI